MIIYMFIENVARRIMEWAIKRQDKHNKVIINELNDSYGNRVFFKRKIK